MRDARTTSRRGARGVAMIEALVTIIILAFGLLGLVGMQAKMQAAEVESYQRTQALILLQDAAARLNANRGAAAEYVTGAPVGTGDLEPVDCSAKAIGSARDLCEWSNALKGGAEQLGGNAVGSVIGGRGCIEAVGGGGLPQYRIVVTWQGLHRTLAPSFGCAQGSYGNEALGLRRAVARVVTIGNLLP